MSANRIKLVIFDLDGTLTVPYLDFKEIRDAVGVDDDKMLVLDYLNSLEGKKRRTAFEVLHNFEKDAAVNAELQEGVLELLDELRKRDIITAIQTRNSKDSVDLVFSKFGIEINHIYTRSDAPPKPDPFVINSLIRRYNLRKKQVIMVGDFWPDVETGRNAGVRTVLLNNEKLLDLKIEPDAKIKRLPDLLPLIEKWSTES